MKKGISIHIGLNTIDPKHYGSDGRLKNPENDARAMSRLAEGLGFAATTILTKEATTTRVQTELFNASKKIGAGDTLLVTFAGHGAQVEDLNKEEEDKYDETWVLYDRMFLDDEIHNAWSKFEPGVRIIVLSDSCHSGTVVRMINFDSITKANKDQVFRCLNPIVATKAFEKHIVAYTAAKSVVPRGIEEGIKASVLLISGCQDDQLSSDGIDNGLFTSKLLRSWANGTFSGTYKGFHSRITSQMPSNQTPNYLFIGNRNDAFEAEKPFTIESSRGVNGTDAEKIYNGSNGHGRKISWELEVNEDLIFELSSEDLESNIRSLCGDLMIESFNKFKELSSQLSLPRGGEISGGCSTGDKGWSCEVKGSIRF
jgi:metacaspase-1